MFCTRTTDLGTRALVGAHVSLSALAVVVLGAVAFATTASAQSRRSGLVVVGQVTVRDVRVRVDCGRSVGSVLCHVEQRFELEAEGSEGQFWASGSRDMEVSLDGWRSNAASLPQGRRVRVEVRYTVGRGGGWPVLVPQLSLRHPALGESWRFYRADDSVQVAVPTGDGLRLEGEAVYEAHGVDGLRVLVGTEGVVQWPHRSSSWSDVRVEFIHRPEPFANGGPVITIGGQIRTDAPGGTPLLGVGYEVGLVEHLVLSLWFETNIEAIAQALIIELVSPGFFIVPSVAAGVGLVVTELGPRGVDAALRLRLSLSTWAVGFVADFDFYASTGSWQIGLAGRIGI